VEIARGAFEVMPNDDEDHEWDEGWLETVPFDSGRCARPRFPSEQ
jgi:hypothetical protein